MTAALNYAVAAAADLKKKLRHFSPVDQTALRDLISRIERSVHFSVPDNGDIFDDGFRGLQGVEVKLPFPEITVEYRVTQVETHPDLIQAPKRLIVAWMERTDDLKTRLSDATFRQSVPSEVTSEWVVHVAAVCDFDQGSGWVPMPAAYCILSSGWNDYSHGKAVTPFRGDVKNPGIAGFPVVILPDITLEYYDRLGRNVETLWKHICNDVGAEASTIMELCEALTCANVGVTTIQKVKPSINERRIRDGKLPLFEVKALEIITPGMPKDLMFGEKHGEHSGPRQHLRRGHIRCLQDGRRIWVSSCVVGSYGKIDKTYSIKSVIN